VVRGEGGRTAGASRSGNDSRAHYVLRGSGNSRDRNALSSSRSLSRSLTVIASYFSRPHAARFDKHTRIGGCTHAGMHARTHARTQAGRQARAATRGRAQTRRSERVRR